jgi:hypothetical protein
MFNKYKKELITYLFLFIPYLFFCYFLINDRVDWGDDYAGYLLQAKYYSSGDFTYLNKLIFISQKSSEKLFPPGYPPMYSFFLSFFYKINLESFLYFKFVNIIFYLFFLISAYLFCKQQFDKINAFWITLFFSVNPIIIKIHINLILSDIVFLFFSSSAIFLMINFFQNKIIKNHSAHFLLLSLFIVCSILTKITGIILVITFLLCLFFYKKKNSFFINSISFFIIIFFLIIILFNKSYVFYLYSLLSKIFYDKNYVQDFFSSFYYHFFVSEYFFGGGRYAQLIFDFSLIFVLLGIIKNYKLLLPSIIFFFLYFLVVVIQTSQQGERYLLPIFPFYILFFYLGLSNFNINFNKNFFKFNFFIIILFFLIIKSSIFSYREFYQIGDNKINNFSPKTKFSQDMFRFILENTNSEEIIVFRKPRALTLFTNRNSFMSDNIQFLNNTKYNYIVLDKNNIDYQINYESISKSTFVHDKVFENNDFFIFERNKKN